MGPLELTPKLVQKVLRKPLKKPVGNDCRTGGSRGEARGKLGEASYFWGKHGSCAPEFLEKTGEAIGPSTPFIILMLSKVAVRG